MKRIRPGGQSLVLFCLMMLLVTVMVCLTISFSMRVREKMEAQSVADLAAYSSAVATARTFNSIALLRRAQTGHMVAITGVQSLISWTSLMRANLDAARLAASGCPAAAEALDHLNEEHAAVQQEWHRLDALAGVQAYNIQGMAGHLGSLQKQMFGRLKDAVSGGPDSFAQKLAELTSEGRRFPDELRADGRTYAPDPPEDSDLEGDYSDDHVSVKELRHATSNGNSHGIDMAMASRGYEFITRRQGMPAYSGPKGILGALQAAGAHLVIIDGGGSAYWGETLEHGGPTAGDFTWAEDHALVEVSFPGCAPLQLQATAGVKSTDLEDGTDDHWWTPAGPALGGSDPGLEKQYRHTLRSCWPRKYCPSTFVGGITFNTNDHSDDNLWAQPKLFGHVQRDYKVRGLRSDPWNLLFRFRFTPDRVNTFDSHGWYLADGTDISVQSALATGLAYYHRRGHWREAPNLWNPFWRATLVAADSDNGGDPRRGGNDVPFTVGETAGEAFRQLIQAGYKGVH